MRIRSFAAVASCFVSALIGCGGSDDTSASAGASTSGGASSASSGAGGGSADACAPRFDDDTIHLAAGAELTPGADTTMCLRWTTPEPLDITGFVGELGPGGHHALLLTQSTPNVPDGLAPCTETELMDAQTSGFTMLAGVSYESSGKAFSFPKTPVQVGLSVPKGTQLVFDAHFVNATATAKTGCATLDLERGAKVVARLELLTILPKEEYGLTVPAHDSASFDGTVPVAKKVRVAAASSHMHAGGTHFRMSIAPTDQTLYETTEWADPAPKLYDTQKVVLDPSQQIRIECTVTNDGASAIHFPDQMCVGGIYVLPCSLPGAC